MADAPAFDYVCAQIEERTALSRLEARGTVRLALKEAGLDTRSVTPAEMAAVLERVLPGELGARGIDAPDALCAALRGGVSRLSAKATAETPEAVFRRLSGDT